MVARMLKFAPMETEYDDTPGWTSSIFGYQYPIVESEDPSISLEVDLLPEGISICFRNQVWELKVESGEIPIEDVEFESPDIDEVVSHLNLYLENLDTFIQRFM